MLDADTAADLEVPRLIDLVDHTLCTPGKVALDALLATPLTDAQALAQRSAQLQACEGSTVEIAAIRQALDDLGHSPHPEGLLGWVREELPPRPPGLWAHSALALLAVVAVAGSLAIGGQVWISVVALFFINMAAHYQSRRGIELHIDTLRELGRLVRCGRKLNRLPMTGFEDNLKTLGDQASKLSRLPRLTALLLPTSGGNADIVTGIADYISIAFLVETRAYGRVLSEVAQHQQTLSDLFDGVGRVDALQSGALYRSTLDPRCEPEFADGSAQLDVEGMVHPLLEDAVPNSISLTERSCVITGSNMAGKSTFLRALGLNALLAQTLCVANATRYRGSMFTIASSMTTSDALADGRSFYYAEAERILTMTRAALAPSPTLCILDELLRGTNSVERLAASESILDWLASRQTLVVVATHDMELVKHLDGRFDGYHFSDSTDNDLLHFDHQLRPGAKATRNGIRLLEHMGFPEEIVAGARAKLVADVRAEAEPRTTG